MTKISPTASCRAVADKVARSTVAALQDFRFLTAHDAAVDGVDRTVAMLSRSDGHQLLVHDDPADQRRLWFGPRGCDIATERSDVCDRDGRLVDVAIRSATLQTMAVRVVPSTGDNGPADDIALLLRDPTVSTTDA